MSIFTAFLNLLKKDPVADKDDTFNISTMLNDNWDKIDAGLKNISKFPKSTGTTAITVTTGIFNLVDGQSFTFIPTGNNGSSATTINADGKGAKPLYKPSTTDAPKITSGKPVTVWYDLAGDCFFIKASAEGNAVASHVLAPNTFSNGDDVGIVGTMVDHGSVGTVNLTSEGSEYTIPQGYHNGLGKVKAVIAGLIASVIKAGTTVGGIVGTFTADATAIASEIATGKTAYVNGNKITGTNTKKYGTGDVLASLEANILAQNASAVISVSKNTSEISGFNASDVIEIGCHTANYFLWIARKSGGYFRIYRLNKTSLAYIDYIDTKLPFTANPTVYEYRMNHKTGKLYILCSNGTTNWIIVLDANGTLIESYDVGGYISAFDIYPEQERIVMINSGGTRSAKLCDLNMNVLETLTTEQVKAVYPSFSQIHNAVLDFSSNRWVVVDLEVDSNACRIVALNRANNNSLVWGVSRSVSYYGQVHLAPTMDDTSLTRIIEALYYYDHQNDLRYIKYGRTNINTGAYVNDFQTNTTGVGPSASMRYQCLQPARKGYMGVSGTSNQKKAVLINGSLDIGQSISQTASEHFTNPYRFFAGVTWNSTYINTNLYNVVSSVEII